MTDGEKYGKSKCKDQKNIPDIHINLQNILRILQGGAREFVRAPRKAGSRVSAEAEGEKDQAHEKGDDPGDEALPDYDEDGPAPSELTPDGRDGRNARRIQQ